MTGRDELLPIIRRKRRPLIVADAPPVAVGNVEPVIVEAKPVEHKATASQAEEEAE